MKKFIIITAILTSIILSACSLVVEEAKNDEESVEVEPFAQIEVVENQSTLEKYIGFLSTDFDLEGYDVVYYEEIDMNLDGKDEVIIAMSDSESADNGDIRSVYILNDYNDQINLIDSIDSSGYMIYEVETVELQNSDQKYLYLGLTNGGNLYGVSLYEVGSNGLNCICNSTSAV